uniref:uncharacterized protein LOC120331446 n=1 Tax=Styela clava TaxID=7725 RepID=UPI00193965A1|nr:uncharacterized protein LOC120331446 [Styela clava]
MLRKNSRNKNVTIINIGNRTIPQETAWVSQFEIIFVGAILMCLLNLRLQIMKNWKDFHLYKDYEDWTITANAFITVVTIAAVISCRIAQKKRGKVNKIIYVCIGVLAIFGLIKLTTLYCTFSSNYLLVYIYIIDFILLFLVVFAGGLMVFSQQYILRFDDGPETFIT